MTILSLILQQAGAQGGGMAFQLLMIGGIIVVFYFFMMRPQMKKAKEQRQFVEELGKGSKVVTIGGLVGKITQVNEKTFVIETRGSSLEILKSAVSHENSRQLNLESKDDGKSSKKKEEEEEKPVEQAG